MQLVFVLTRMISEVARISLYLETSALLSLCSTIGPSRFVKMEQLLVPDVSAKEVCKEVGYEKILRLTHPAPLHPVLESRFRRKEAEAAHFQ